MLLTYQLIFLLLNKQRLNHRNLLLSRINYHRKSEFTEKIHTVSTSRHLISKFLKMRFHRTRIFIQARNSKIILSTANINTDYLCCFFYLIFLLYVKFISRYPPYSAQLLTGRLVMTV